MVIIHKYNCYRKFSILHLYLSAIRLALERHTCITYPALWNIARKFLIAFPSPYCMEMGFRTTVVNLLTKKINILDRGDLRLNLTN